MIWRIRGRDHDLTHRGMVMGIVNVTPDSFSDGGCFFSPEQAIVHARELVAQGADILDIGGESTRPGAEGVPADEEMRRVLPVIEALRRETGIILSIDTSKANVAAAALKAGADLVNDVTGLRGDPEMAKVVRDERAGVVIMHMQGTPRTMQTAPTYSDVTAEIGIFFRHAADRAVACGIDPMSIAFDPGIGFGKTFDHNRELLKNLSSFVELGRPVVVGVSRKSFLGAMANSTDIASRFWPGVAITSFSREKGARVVRVHDVQPHREALRMTEAILGDA